MGDVPQAKVPRARRVQNKAPAAVQITAEQILREAKERQEAPAKPPRQHISDAHELAEYKLRKRKEYEDNLKKNRNHMPYWLKYAHWEESQKEFQRARSVFERALDVDYRNPTLWLKYVEMEMRHKFINHARNIWDRAITLLPRVDQFWYKYSYMEEMVGNIGGARAIFDRWMEWAPDKHAWMSYVKLEVRCKEYDRAREVFERYLCCHPSAEAFIKYAKWEDRLGEHARARAVYERAMEDLAEAVPEEKLFLNFSKFEERLKEPERARAIYKYALENLPKHKAQELYKQYIAFEKQNGEKDDIEDVIVGKRRYQYEEELKLNPRNYDVWFDYIRLEEANGNQAKIRKVYEDAIGNTPPSDDDKRLWKRYIYLWINYAIYEELEAEDIARARDVYKACLRIIPHKVFSFSKIWIMFAHFEIRQMDLEAARKVYGNAIGRAPKDKVYDSYIQLELQLGNIDRCRTLYEKYLTWNPANCSGWAKFAELEKNLGEIERARAIFEIAVGQPVLDMPEVLWKAYIDFEISQEENDKTRELYERLLSKTKHPKVWISYAQFEASVKEIEKAREVFKRADSHLRSANMKQERMLNLEAWKAVEEAEGNETEAAELQKKMPRRIKKKRTITTEDGHEQEEEYFDYIFDDEEGNRPSLKILEMAHKWKKQRVEDEE